MIILLLWPGKLHMVNHGVNHKGKRYGKTYLPKEGLGHNRTIESEIEPPPIAQHCLSFSQDMKAYSVLCLRRSGRVRAMRLAIDVPVVPGWVTD